MKVKDVERAIIDQALVNMRPVEINILAIADDGPYGIGLSATDLSKEELDELLESEVVSFRVKRQFPRSKGPLFLVWGRLKAKNKA